MTLNKTKGQVMHEGLKQGARQILVLFVTPLFLFGFSGCGSDKPDVPTPDGPVVTPPDGDKEPPQPNRVSGPNKPGQEPERVIVCTEYDQECSHLDGQSDGSGFTCMLYPQSEVASCRVGEDDSPLYRCRKPCGPVFGSCDLGYSCQPLPEDFVDPYESVYGKGATGLCVKSNCKGWGDEAKCVSKEKGESLKLDCAHPEGWRAIAGEEGPCKDKKVGDVYAACVPDTYNMEKDYRNNTTRLDPASQIVGAAKMSGGGFYLVNSRSKVEKVGEAGQTCFSQSDCNPGLACGPTRATADQLKYENRCFKPCTSNATGQCSADEKCVGYDNPSYIGSGVGECSKLGCDVGESCKLEDGNTGKCKPFSEKTGKCVLNGNKKEFDSCKMFLNDTERNDANNRCGDGLTCTLTEPILSDIDQKGLYEGVCLRTCSIESLNQTERNKTCRRKDDPTLKDEDIKKDIEARKFQRQCVQGPWNTGTLLDAGVCYPACFAKDIGKTGGVKNDPLDEKPYEGCPKDNTCAITQLGVMCIPKTLATNKHDKPSEAREAKVEKEACNRVTDTCGDDKKLSCFGDSLSVTSGMCAKWCTTEGGEDGAGACGDGQTCVPSDGLPTKFWRLYGGNPQGVGMCVDLCKHGEATDFSKSDCEGERRCEKYVSFAEPGGKTIDSFYCTASSGTKKKGEQCKDRDMEGSKPLGVFPPDRLPNECDNGLLCVTPGMRRGLTFTPDRRALDHSAEDFNDGTCQKMCNPYLATSGDKAQCGEDESCAIDYLDAVYGSRPIAKVGFCKPRYTLDGAGNKDKNAPATPNPNTTEQGASCSHEWMPCGDGTLCVALQGGAQCVRLCDLSRPASERCPETIGGKYMSCVYPFNGAKAAGHLAGICMDN